MRIKGFYTYITSIVMILLVIIGVLSWLLYIHGPRVRNIELPPQLANTSLHNGQTLSIQFDRPLLQSDYTNQIRIEPAVEFTTQTFTKTIAVTLKENLQHNTEYTLSVGPAIYDTTNRTMNGTYTRQLNTNAPAYAYIERNVDADDYLIMGTIGGKQERIFSHPQISLFSANDAYAAVAAYEDTGDTLYILDLSSREVRAVNTAIEGRFVELALSARGNSVLFTQVPDFNRVSTDYYNQYANILYSLDAASGELTQITSTEDKPQKAFSVHTDTNGQFVLIQDGNQTYYAASPYNDFEPILIGSHIDAYGFNDDSTEILFRDTASFSRYDIASGTLEPLQLESDYYVRKLQPKNNEILAFSTLYKTEEFIDYIDTLKPDSQSSELLWTNDGNNAKNVVDFSASHDAVLLAIQVNANDCSYDDLPRNKQCRETETIIVDSSNQATIERFRGFGLVWLP